jgi:hypothetical protein
VRRDDQCLLKDADDLMSPYSRCRSLALAIVLAGASASCQARQVPATANPALIVLPGAQDVRTADIYDGQVTYKLHVPYPGEDSINEIRRRLTALEWRPRDRDLLNPTLSYAVTTKWRRMQVEKGDLLGWSENWENAAGDVVLCGFSYIAESFADPAATTPMEVICSRFVASSVAAIEHEQRTGENKR